MLRLALPFSAVHLYPESRLVVTVFSDGKQGVGTRDDTEENRAQAMEQGYSGGDMVWNSLAHHELLHSLISLWLWDTASPTLVHEAGGKPCEYGRRLYEEALVIGAQRYINTGDIWPALTQYRGDLPRWKQGLLAALGRMEQAA